MHLSPASLKLMAEKGLIALESETVFRGPHMDGGLRSEERLRLNEEQQKIVTDFTDRYDRGIRETSLIYGVTGSGKTEVYMEIISHVLKNNRDRSDLSDCHEIFQAFRRPGVHHQFPHVRRRAV